MLLLEFFREPIDDLLVPVVTAESGITIRGLNLKYPLGDLQNGNVEGAATKIVDRDGFFAAFLQTIGQ